MSPDNRYPSCEDLIGPCQCVSTFLYCCWQRQDYALSSFCLLYNSICRSCLSVVGSRLMSGALYCPDPGNPISTMLYTGCVLCVCMSCLQFLVCCYSTLVILHVSLIGQQLDLSGEGRKKSWWKLLPRMIRVQKVIIIIIHYRLTITSGMIKLIFFLLLAEWM